MGVAAALIALSLSAGSAASVALAENGSNKDFEDFLKGKGNFNFNKLPSELSKDLEQTDPSLNINPNGKVLVTNGEIMSFNYPNFTVKVWGVTLSGIATSSSVLIGNGTSTTSWAKVGDKVDISGTIDKNNGVLNAHRMRNRTTVGTETSDVMKRISDLLKQIEDLRAQLKNIRGNF